MYVYLVVFHGAELKNKCFSTWNCTVCPFSVGIGVLLGLNQGDSGMLDLEFFEKKISHKNSYSKIYFYKIDYLLFIILITFPLIF